MSSSVLHNPGLKSGVNEYTQSMGFSPELVYLEGDKIHKRK
jgi:hypothetical protein